MKRCISLFIFLLITQVLAAQQTTISEKEYVLKYKKAVQLYAAQQYLEAQNELMPLTHRKYTHLMVPYTHFYLALCLFKTNNFFETRVILRQLFERFPDWNKIEEGYYLYADAALSDSYFDEGMQYINRISEPKLKNDVENMVYSHFSKIRNRIQLKELQLKFPNNAMLAQLLINDIQQSKQVSKEDLEISDQLTNRFGLSKSLSGSNKKITPKRDNKGVINIGVLLPFRLNDFDISQSNRANQYIYDMYAGMKLAKSKLETERIPINLLTFDIDRDGSIISPLVENNQFSQVDLLIGPLYPEANRMIINFIRSNDIMQVHPLSNNQQLINGEKNIFLASPSFETQSAKALEYMKTQSIGRTAAIYYGLTRKDSTFAYAYRDEAIKAGIEIITIRKFTDIEDIDTRRKPNHIFISGTDESFGKKVINALDKKKINAPIIANSSGFDFTGSSLNIFNRELALIQLEYINQEKEEVKNFRSSYFNEQNTPPSFYSHWGYDILLFYSRMLYKGKNQLRSNLNAIEYTQGFTLDGFDYTNGTNENQIVPIIKYQNGKFIEVMR